MSPTVASANPITTGASRPAGSSRLRVWLAAARPATLLAAAAPVLVGTAAAAAAGGLAWLPALAALLGAGCLQIGCNFANDVYDFESGADNDRRLGPTRAVHAGWVSPASMRRAMWMVFALATVIGGYLTLHAGWPVIAIGVASIVAAIAYTGGPFPLGYHGLGDLFVILFFGFVAVGGTAFVQLGELPAAALWLGWPPGALAAAILVVNNLRDHQTDAEVGKRTLAVRFGPRFAVWEYAVLGASAHALPCVLVVTGVLPTLALLSILSAPVFFAVARKLARTADPRALNPLLGATARILLLHSVLLALGIYLGSP